MFRLDSRPSASSTAITIVGAALLGIGVVMVFSAGASLTAPPIARDIFRNPSMRQAAFAIAALLTLLVVGLCPHEVWRFRKGVVFQPTILLAAFATLLLATVLLFGQERHGARRWLSLGPAAGDLSIQPSEVAKLAIVLFLAAYGSFMGERIRRFWSGLAPAALVLALFVALVGIEDFGTGVLILAVGGCVLLAAGARVWHLAVLSLPTVAGLIHLIAASPYRVRRLLTFLDPFADPQGSGYHQVQSLITIASGGWWGRGLGAGIQKYGYLPEGRNDFIFAVICEESGIIGGVAVIALFAVLMWQGRRAMLRAETDFGRLLVLAASLMIGLQAAMNIAVVTVSLPTKGISLPLVSAGGTGVILISALAGLMANVARERRALGELPADAGGPARTGDPGGLAAAGTPVSPTVA